MEEETKEVKFFSREELQAIFSRAYKLADTDYLNPSWKRVLLSLGDAACSLDAFIARTVISENRGVKDIPEGKNMV